MELEEASIQDINEAMATHVLKWVHIQVAPQSKGSIHLPWRHVTDLSIHETLIFPGHDAWAYKGMAQVLPNIAGSFTHAWKELMRITDDHWYRLSSQGPRSDGTGEFIICEILWRDEGALRWVIGYAEHEARAICIALLRLNGVEEI